MKILSLFTLLLCMIPGSVNAKTIREVVYKGKLDDKAILKSLHVSKFYGVDLKKDINPSFEYSLKKDLKNEDFNVGIYQTTGFQLIPTITSRLVMSLKASFIQVGEFKVDGETVSFDGEMKIDDTKIGTINYAFNMFKLPVRKVYNPKVKQTVENVPGGFEVVEYREMP